MFQLKRREVGVDDAASTAEPFVIECQRCGVRRSVPALTGDATGECTYCGHARWGFPDDLARRRLRARQLTEAPARTVQHDWKPVVDPVTGFRSRENLLRDVAAAVAPGESVRVLAVVDLAGADEYRQIHGVLAADVLIGRLAGLLEHFVGDAGTCYRSRQDEFWVAFDAEPDEARVLLGRAISALREAGGDACVTASFGLASLPLGAGDPIGALAAADQALGSARRSRERRTLPR